MGGVFEQSYPANQDDNCGQDQGTLLFPGFWMTQISDQEREAGERKTQSGVRLHADKTG
jgi:hypothetical protein